MSGTVISQMGIGTLQRLIGAHPYFKDWGGEQVKAVEPFVALVQADPAQQLLELEDLSPYEYFLLDGRLQLEKKNGEARELEAADLDAEFPIAHLRPSQYRVTSQTPVKLIRFEGSQLKAQMQQLRKQPRQARFRMDDAAVSGSWQSHAMVAQLMAELRQGSLKIPSMPSVAMRIRRTMASPDFGMHDIATIISADPSIAARLIQMANSAVFGGITACDTVQSALVRLGVEKTRNLVFTLATRNLFNARQAFIQSRMLKAWQHAIEIAALCAVLAKLSPGLDTDRALLTGLLHEIGSIPILKVAESYPDLADTPGLLDEIVKSLTPEISAEVLKRWGFPEDFSQAAGDQSDWYREQDGPADYGDLIIVAHLHALVRERQFHKLPRLDETPAFQKLALGLLSPQLSLLVLDEAKGQIQELKALLS